MRFPRGLGFLLTTEVDHVDLGTYGGRHLRGRTHQRLLRVAIGERAAARLALSRVRPVAVEVTERGRSYELPIHVRADPWLAAAGRLLLLALLALALPARPLSRRPKHAEESDEHA